MVVQSVCPTGRHEWTVRIHRDVQSITVARGNILGVPTRIATVVTHVRV